MAEISYTKTNWVNNVTKLNADNMNHIENGIETLAVALNTKASVDYVDKTHYGCSGSDLLIIPEGTTTIDYSSGYEGSAYKCVVLPDSVVNITNGAFQNCGNLKEIIFGNGLKYIGDSAFASCTGLTTITIPDSVTDIDMSAFVSCTELTSITIGSGVTHIGVNAFAGCYALKNITIPNNVTNIDGYAFEDCQIKILDLTAFTTESFPTIEASLGIITSDSFQIRVIKGRKSELAAMTNWSIYADYIVEVETADTAVTTAENYTNKTHYGYSGDDLLIIPEGTTIIDDYAYKTTNYKCVVIPNSVTSIGNVAFGDCSSLTNIIIPDSVTSIGKNAFINCTGLTNITIPDSVTSIGNNAFDTCSSLTSITIPNNVTSILNMTFLNCSSLTSISIPNSVTSIKDIAFSGCNSLTSITIPGSVTSIGWYAFSDCPLETIDLTAYTTQSFPTLGAASFNSIAANCQIKVVKGRKAELAAMTNWSEYADHIVEVPTVETVDEALATKLDTSNVVQITGQSTTSVMSQKATTDEIDILKSDITDLQNETPTIVCNPTLYATVGHEFVLYYNNILRCMRPENFVVTTVLPSGSTLSSLEPEFERCLKFTPTSTNIGTHAVTIKVIDKSTWLTVAEKAINIIISADSTRRNRKVMFIGDSLTYASTYGAEIANMSNDGIVSIGTIDHAITFNDATVHVKTEGRNGYASYDYVAKQTAHGATNPFYNPNTEYSLTLDKKYTSATGVLTFDNSGTVSILKHHFDFAYYMANNSAAVGTPDAVFINLGTNGGNGYALSDVYVAFDAMIDRIHAYNAELPIFLHLFPPTSDAGNTSRAAAVRNVWPELDSRVGYYDCIQILIDRYKNDSRVTIVPVNTILDRLYDYKLETVPVSARNPIEVTIGQSDAVHPAKPGYLHMADAYYNVLQHLWNTDDPVPTPTYTNLNAGAGTVITNGFASLDKCVYQAGTYISTAATTSLNADANATTFGMIPAADGDTIYTKGITIPLNISQATVAQTHARLGFANHTDKTRWIAEHKFYNSSSNYVTVTVLDEATKYYKIQLSASTGLTYNYIGISFDTTNGGADTLIITKNEPIQ